MGSVTTVTGSFLSELDPAYGLRPEFGELVRRSGRTLNERSLAQLIGAENLLTKAVASRAAGDLDRAEQLVRRAAAMPYDDREGDSPGVRGAAMLVYTLVTDQLEASSLDDQAWLDVALDVHPRLDGLGQAKLASVVHGFVLQDVLFSVSPTERGRIKQAFGDAPLEVDLGDRPGLTVDQRRDIIDSLVTAAVALREGYAGSGRG